MRDFITEYRRKPREKKTTIMNLLLFSNKTRETQVWKLAAQKLNIEHVHVATVLEQAMALIQSYKIDLFVAKWDESTMAGGMLLQHARAMAPYVHAPFLLFSEVVDASKVYLGMEFDLTEYVFGPLDVQGILPKLAYCLSLLQDSNPLTDKRSALLFNLKLCKITENYEQGAMLIEAFLLENGVDDQIILYQAVFFFHLARYEEAILLAKQVAKTEAMFVPAYHLLGNIYIKQRNIDEALRLFEKARMFSPYHVDRLVQLGELYFQKGDLIKSQARFHSAYLMNPISEAAVQGLAKTLIEQVPGTSLIEQVKTKFHSRANFSLYNTLAVMLVKKERFKEAHKLYQQAIKFAQTEAYEKSRIYFNLGLLYEKTLAFDRAKRAYDEAIKLSPLFEKAKSRLSAIVKHLEVAKFSSPELNQESESQEVAHVSENDLIHLASYQKIVRLGKQIGKQKKLDAMLALVANTFFAELPHGGAMLLKTSPAALTATEVLFSSTGRKGGAGLNLNRVGEFLGANIEIEIAELTYIEHLKAASHLSQPSNPTSAPGDSINLLNIPVYREDKWVYHLIFWGNLAIDPQKHIETIRIMVSHIENTIKSTRHIQKITQKLYIDELSGLYNVKMLKPALIKAINQLEALGANRQDRSLVMFFMDMDDFKRVNDRHGHLIGSKLLVAVGKILRQSATANDILIRYGGDEYVVILPQVTIGYALQRAEKIRKAVADETFSGQNGDRVKVTVSIGVAAYPEHAQTLSRLIELSDKAMYEAKRASKNKVYLTSV